MADAEIVERCILALANEGARILEEGIALRASDIDIVYLTGYGFPPTAAGRCSTPTRIGLAKVLADMERYARGYHGECWTPAPLLARLAARRQDVQLQGDRRRQCRSPTKSQRWNMPLLRREYLFGTAPNAFLARRRRRGLRPA